MKTIIILNGPPGCGKDTIATRLAQSQYAPLSFKAPMFKIAKDMLGTAQFKEFMYRYNRRTLKEAEWKYIGMSPRQLMIHISEKFVKPIVGQEAFGRLAADEVVDVLSKHPYLKGVVFSDGGFESELKDLSAVSGARVKIVHLHRDGYTFEGDSRNYMGNPDLVITLEEGKPEVAVIQILEHLNERL